MQVSSYRPIDTLCCINLERSDNYYDLTSLDDTKTVGIDNISLKMLKSCASTLCEPINSLGQSYLPEEWKLHYITPNHKYETGPSCSIILKVLEMLIYSYMIKSSTSSHSM